MVASRACATLAHSKPHCIARKLVTTLHEDRITSIFSRILILGAIAMKLSRIRPISYFKANAAEIVRQLAEQREPMVITQNGEATAVIQDVASYEETQETMALLKILALGNRQIEAGRVTPAVTAIRHLRQRKAAA